MRAPAAPRVGAVVAAQDCKGYWYAATVLAVSDDSVPQYLVTFRGFPAAQNESVSKNRIRQNLTKAQIVHLNAATAWGNSTAGLDAARGTWVVDEITANKGRRLMSDGFKYLTAALGRAGLRSLSCPWISVAGRSRRYTIMRAPTRPPTTSR